jgi:predicted DNA binding protein
MKLISLTIAPRNPWSGVSEKNPLRAVVKLNNKESTVECVLSDDAMRRMLDLCADEIAESARKNVDEFVAAVRTIDGDKSDLLIEGTA